MLSLTLLLSVLLPSVAAAAPMMDTGVACYGPVPDELVPIDGSVGVSPLAIPAMLAYADCGDGEIQVTLTPNAGPATATTVAVADDGIYWLTDLTLSANTAYVLTATDGASNTMVSTFATGDGALPTLSGVPSIAITGSTLAADGPEASVSLELSLVPDPFGAVFTLSRDGSPVLSGVNDPTSVVDSFGGSDGQEVCYSVRQFNADGTPYATSVETCVYLAADVGDKVHGCSTSGGAGVGSILIGAGLLLSLARGRRHGPESR